MADSTEADLLSAAARAIAVAVSGCSSLDRRNTSEAQPWRQPQEAIDVFGPLIVEAWTKLLEGKSPDDQVRAFEKLMRVSDSDAREHVTKLLSVDSADSSEADRLYAAEYLTAIPATASCALEESLHQLAQTTMQPTVEFFRFLPASAPPFRVGDIIEGTPYQLDRLLGSGGFGAVFLARNQFEQHSDPRALKFCTNVNMIDSLKRERALLDQLMRSAKDSSWSHRIVRLLGHALDVKTPFLVYEYVKGGALPSWLMRAQAGMERKIRPREVLTIIRQIAEGLAFAHGEGLVHRDIKPANILMARDGVRITDFGIGGLVSSQSIRRGQANAVSGMTVLDRTNLVRGSGTPLYMSPEQRRGDSPDPTHDIYSLGVLWYQLLVGDVKRELHPGWQEEIMEEHDVPKAHAELIRDCVGYHKNRPANGGELLQRLPAKPAKSGTARSSTSSRAALQSLRTIGSHSGPIRAVRLSRGGRHALTAADDGTMSYVHLQRGEVLQRIAPRDGPIRACSFTRKEGEALSVSDGGLIRLWSLTSGELLESAETNWTTLRCAACTGNGSFVAVASNEDSDIFVWSTKTGKAVRRLKGHIGLVNALRFSGRLLVSGSDDRSVRLWNVEETDEVLSIHEHEAAITDVDVSADQQWVVSSSLDQTVRVWNAASGKQVSSGQNQVRTVESVAFDPSGDYFYTGGRDFSIRKSRSEDGAQLASSEGHRNWVTVLEASPSGKEIVSGSLDKTVVVWQA